MMRRRLEKTEQADTVQLLEALGAAVYVLGTRRPRGRPCPACGTFVHEHAGTCQTPGIADLVVFLPARPRYVGTGDGPRPVLFVEQKAERGRLAPAQVAFRELVTASSATYVSGTCDEVMTWLTDRGYLRHPGGLWAPRSVWEGE